MPWYRINGTIVHMRGSKLPAPCNEVVEIDGRKQRCMAMSSILCDWPLGNGKTCDVAVCADHAKEVRKDTHLCPAHVCDHEISRTHSPLFTSLLDGSAA